MRYSLVSYYRKAPFLCKEGVATEKNLVVLEKLSKHRDRAFSAIERVVAMERVVKFF